MNGAECSTTAANNESRPFERLRGGFPVDAAEEIGYARVVMNRGPMVARTTARRVVISCAEIPSDSSRERYPGSSHTRGNPGSGSVVDPTSPDVPVKTSHAHTD